MQTTKATPGYRRSSMPATVNMRKNSTPAAAKPAANTTSSMSSSSATTAAAAAKSPAASDATQKTASGTSPLILTPVSQLPKAPRRASRPEIPLSENASSWDPDHYNPDGSLRTMHRMPGFDQSYAQAMKARYIRHPEKVEREKELSVNQIFDKQ